MAKRVLVVDDVAEIRTLIQRVLSADGYQVDVAGTLAEARSMDPARYSAVLVDAHLGAEHGTDLIEELRSSDPSAGRRCLVITGDQADTGPPGLAFLAKPFQAADLLKAVRMLPQPDKPQAEPGPPTSSPVALSPTGSPTEPAPALGLGPGFRPSPGSGPRANPPPSPVQVKHVLSVARRVRSRERRELIGFLHDGPIQELTAGTLEAAMMRKSALAAPMPRIDAVLRQMDAAARSLRWLVDGDWPFMQPEVQLASALQQRSAWLLAEPLTTDIDARCAELTAADVPTVVDAAELMLLAMLPEDRPVRAHLAVRGKPRLIELELTLTVAGEAGQPVGDPAPAQAALRDLAEAVGSVAHSDCQAHCWQARITLQEWAE